MKQFVKNLSSITMAALLGTIIFLCGFVVALLLPGGESFANAASWAQAIGGFLAIAAAWSIGHSQSEAAKDATRLADQLMHERRCKSLHALADELVTVSTEAYEAHKDKNMFSVSLTQSNWELPLVTLIDELNIIRALDFGDQRILALIIRLKTSASYLKQMLDRMPDAADRLFMDGNNTEYDHLLDVIHINQKEIARITIKLKERLLNPT